MSQIRQDIVVNVRGQSRVQGLSNSFQHNKLKSEQLRKEIKKTGNEMEKGGKKMGKARTQASAYTTAIRALTSAIVLMARTAVIGFVVGIGAAFVKSARAAIRFERDMAQVRKTTTLTGAELKKVGDALLEMEVRLTTSREALIAIAERAGQLGIRGASNIVLFTETVAKLERVSDLTAEQAGQYIAQISNSFRIPIEQAENLASVMNELSNTTVAFAGDIGTALAKVAGTGRLVGFTVDQVAAMGATLIDTGTVADRAGTQLRNIFIMLQTEADRLGAVMGVTGDQFSAALSEAPLETLKAYLKALREMPTRLQSIHISDVFGARNFTALDALVNRTDLLNRNLFTAAKAFDENVSLTIQFEAATANVATEWKKFANTVKVWATHSASNVLPMLNRWGQQLNNLRVSNAEIVDSIKSATKEGDRYGTMARDIARYQALMAKEGKLTSEELGEQEALFMALTKALPGFVGQVNHAGEAMSFLSDEASRFVAEQEAIAQLERADLITQLIRRTDKLEEKTEEATAKAARLRAEFERQLEGGPDVVAAWGGAAIDGISTIGEELEYVGQLMRALAQESEQFNRSLVSMFAKQVEIGGEITRVFDQQAFINLMVAAGYSMDEVYAKLRLLATAVADLNRRPDGAGGGGDGGEGTATGELSDEVKRAQEAVREYIERLEQRRQLEALVSEDATKALKERFSLEAQIARLHELDVQTQGTMKAVIQEQVVILQHEMALLDRRLGMYGEAHERAARLSEELRQAAEAIGEAGMLEDDLAEGLAESELVARRLRIEMRQRLLATISDTISHVADLADAFELLGENSERFMDGLIRAVDAAHDLQAVLKTLKPGAGIGDILGAGGGAPMAAAITAAVQMGASFIGPLIQHEREAKKQAAEQRKRAMEVAVDNAKRITRAIESLKEAQIGQDIAGVDAARITGLIDRFLAFGGPSGAADPKERADEDRRRREVFSELRHALVTSGNQALSDIASGLTLDNFAGYMDQIRTVLDSIGEFNTTLPGLLEKIRFMARFMGIDVVEAMVIFRDGLGNLEGIPEEIRKRLAGIDLSTSQGQAALRQLIADVARGITEGTFGFAGLTPGQTEDMLTFLQGLADGEILDAEGNRTTLQVQRSISDVAANEVILLLRQVVHWVRATARALGVSEDYTPLQSTRGVSGGPLRPPGLPFDPVGVALDEDGTGLMDSERTRTYYGGGLVWNGDIRTGLSFDNPDMPRVVAQMLEDHLRRKQVQAGRSQLIL